MRVIQRRFANDLLTSALLTCVLCSKENIPPVIPRSCSHHTFCQLSPAAASVSQSLIVFIPSSDLSGSGDLCAARRSPLRQRQCFVTPPITTTASTLQFTSSFFLPPSQWQRWCIRPISGLWWATRVLSASKCLLAQAVFNICFSFPPC